MEDKNKKVKRLMIDALLLYVFSSILLIAIRFVFAVLDGEPLVENIALNFRSYIFSLNFVDTMYLVTRFENIGLLSVLLAIFWALFFYYVINNFVECKRKSMAVIIVALISILSGLITKFRLPFCVVCGGILLAIVYLIFDIILPSIEKRHSQSGIVTMSIFRVLFCLIAIVSIGLEVIKYIEF